MASGVGDLENRGRGDGLLEEVESVLAAIVPIEGFVLACEFVETVRDTGKIANERAVIVGKVEEGTKLEEGLGRGVLDEGCDLRGVHTDAFSGDNVAKVFDARTNKRTFVDLGVEFLLSEDREDLANVLKMGLEGGAKDEDVIKVHDDTDFEEVTEDVVHGGLECGGGIVTRVSGTVRSTTMVESLAPNRMVIGESKLVEERPALQTQASVMKLLVAPISRRARNFTVDASRETAINLSWNRAVPTQAEEIMVLRRRCSKPNLTSRSCRACSSTRSEKVVEEGLGMRVKEQGIPDVVGRGAGGVDCVAWGSSDGMCITEEGVGRRIVDAKWATGGVEIVTDGRVGRQVVDPGGGLQESGEQCSSGGGPGCHGGGRSGSRRVGGAGGSGRGLVMGVEESIVVKRAREEVGKGHVRFVGKGGCKIFVAYSLDAGDERKVGNDGGGKVMAEGAGDRSGGGSGGTSLAEVTELFEAVINGFLGAEGGSEKVGPLEEGVTRSSGGAAVADFGHPPFGGISRRREVAMGSQWTRGMWWSLKEFWSWVRKRKTSSWGRPEKGMMSADQEGTGDFPFAGNDPGEGIEVEVIGGSVVAGVIELVVVVKEVVGGKLWRCKVNPGGDLGIGGMGGGDVEVVMMGYEGGGRVEEAEVVDVVAEVVGVEEVGGGVWLEAAVDVGLVVVTTWMEGVVVWDSRAVDVGTVVEFASKAVNRLGVDGGHIDAGGLGHVGEDGVDAVAEATTADEVEADAAAAAAVAAAAHSEVLVWRGGMWRFGSGSGWGGYLQH
ncbi:hypothetical protein CBR_g8547 [Chara braunii]|uniref:Uncharacterized protein n=1 Tax=Chara braunii TaxID=69332 RepID=A0A388KMF9_CHABU|nr:hypothetical protein CBR_g8547 [Chara braunii]|eukprot:GBG71244.1 hypothetical protein CBR_g8547 [Chara braunii]